MPTFDAHDGTTLAYRVLGDGAPVVCLPGGPMQDCVYLGDLGGLTRHRQLIMLDPRGVGRSAIPDDPSSWRCDRLVDDVDALREHLDLERIELLAHSAGANLAVRYVERHPDRVSKIALITPSTMAVGVTVPGQVRLETARLRRDEPWFPAAFDALTAIVAGEAGPDRWKDIAPFYYARWDAAAQAFEEAEEGHQNTDAAAVFGSEGAFDPEATRTALTQFPRPVLLLAGEYDVNSPPRAIVEFSTLFPHAEVVVQREAGHFPWHDDADRFVSTTAAFLDNHS